MAIRSFDRLAFFRPFLGAGPTLGMKFCRYADISRPLPPPTDEARRKYLAEKVQQQPSMPKCPNCGATLKSGNKWWFQCPRCMMPVPKNRQGGIGTFNYYGIGDQ